MTTASVDVANPMPYGKPVSHHDLRRAAVTGVEGLHQPTPSVTIERHAIGRCLAGAAQEGSVVTTATVTPSKAVRITWAVIGTVIAGISIYLLWWLAIPRTNTCGTVTPAPPGCATTNRFGIAAIWTAVVIAAYLAAMASLAVRVRVWVRLLLGALFVGSAVWAYYSTLHATPLGFGN